ncbi:MAG TPA: DsrE family protein [Acidimicrobiia bacterium]|nr:DsrE family protein [Acidimicrobiia bacterium]
MNVLVILQGPAYGDERAFNGLRLAGALGKRDDVAVRVFCFGDAAGTAIKDQTVPNGYYHLDRMLVSAVHHGAEIGLCGTCMDARGITEGMLIPQARRSSLEEVTDWVLWADKTVTF